MAQQPHPRQIPKRTDTFSPKTRTSGLTAARLTPLTRTCPDHPLGVCTRPPPGLPRPSLHWLHRQESCPVSLARTSPPVRPGPSALPGPGAPEHLAALSTSPRMVLSEATPVTLAVSSW